MCKLSPRPNPCRFFFRLLQTAAALAILVPVQPSAADPIAGLLRETHWGESSGELIRQFGDEARRLRRALDFGDSYADTVLTRQTLGGVPIVVFFQMDKATHGLKRIQLERPSHGVNPPSFRAITAALHADFGKPDQTCVIPMLPASGYQAAAEERWAHDGAVISAIFRDTDPASFRGLPVRPYQRLVRTARTAFGADRPARRWRRPVFPRPASRPTHRDLDGRAAVTAALLAMMPRGITSEEP